MPGPRRSACLLLLCSVSCASVELAADRVRTRLGPAHAVPTRKVVALPATCGSLALSRATLAPPAEPDPSDPAAPAVSTAESNASAIEKAVLSECRPEHLEGVDARVRAALEFQGYEVIDSERVVARTMLRTERQETTVADGQESGVVETDLLGSRFADATPAIQDIILDDLGADGLLNTRIWIGSPSGASGRRTVQVQIRLLHARRRELVWARRCEVEAGMQTDNDAMDRATRCAVEGVAPP